MSMRNRFPTYQHIADLLGVQLCSACAEGNHQYGWVNPSRGVIHFQERLVTRAGIRAFLKLHGSIVHSHNRGQPEWQRLYEQNRWANRQAATMGIHFPKRLSLQDKARAYRMARSEKTDISFQRWSRNRD